MTIRARAGGAAVFVLLGWLAGLLASPEQLRALGEHARAYAAAQIDRFEDGWRAIAPLLPAP